MTGVRLGGLKFNTFATATYSSLLILLFYHFLCIIYRKWLAADRPSVKQMCVYADHLFYPVFYVFNGE